MRQIGVFLIILSCVTPAAAQKGVEVQLGHVKMYFHSAASGESFRFNRGRDVIHAPATGDPESFEAALDSVTEKLEKVETIRRKEVNDAFDIVRKMREVRVVEKEKLVPYPVDRVVERYYPLPAPVPAPVPVPVCTPPATVVVGCNVWTGAQWVTVRTVCGYGSFYCTNNHHWVWDAVRCYWYDP